MSLAFLDQIVPLSPSFPCDSYKYKLKIKFSAERNVLRFYWWN